MKLQLSQDVLKQISKENYYDIDSFIRDVNTYIKAVKSGRILYTVTHVSQSGMSRDISIQSFEGKTNNGSYRSYYMMLKVMGYNFSKYNDIKVSGWGMDMLFATNYRLIHSFNRMGFINKPSCDKLAQKV